MRVRTGRFEKLRSGESGNTEVVEVGDAQHTVEALAAGAPPAAGVAGDARGQVRAGTLTSRSRLPGRPFSHEARSPQVRERDPSPHSRRIYVAWALTTRASRSLARSPCPTPPRMRFVSLDSRFTLHASFPRSVALTQLRFTSLAVVSSREDLNLQDRAHAGRKKKAARRRLFVSGECLRQANTRSEEVTQTNFGCHRLAAGHRSRC